MKLLKNTTQDLLNQNMLVWQEEKGMTEDEMAG